VILMSRPQQGHKARRQGDRCRQYNTPDRGAQAGLPSVAVPIHIASVMRVARPPIAPPCSGRKGSGNGGEVPPVLSRVVAASVRVDADGPFGCHAIS
jgi:hypothetical protein